LVSKDCKKHEFCFGGAKTWNHYFRAIRDSATPFLLVLHINLALQYPTVQFLDLVDYTYLPYSFLYFLGEERRKSYFKN